MIKLTDYNQHFNIKVHNQDLGHNIHVFYVSTITIETASATI
jgi:hypothetical protein